MLAGADSADDLYGSLSAQGANVNIESRYASRLQGGKFGLLEVQDVASLHCFNVFDGCLDDAQNYVGLQARVVDRLFKAFAPLSVRVLVAIACLNPAAQ